MKTEESNFIDKMSEKGSKRSKDQRRKPDGSKTDVENDIQPSTSEASVEVHASGSTHTARFPDIPKAKKKDDKQRRKDPRSWENVKKSLNDIAVSEDKLKYLTERYNEIYNELRSSQLEIDVIKKGYANHARERDLEQKELSKAILAKGHLENLCRELQKQNKAIKDENFQRLKDEEEKRREVANTFTERLNTLTALINESKEKSNKVKEENQIMSERLAELYQQSGDREQQLDHKNKQVDLQKELYDATIKQHEMVLQSERAQFEQAQKCLALELAKKDHTLRLLEESNKGFQQQIDVYKEQYTEIETTMNKSTRVFDNFKDEMARMKRDYKLIERERDHWRTKWQGTASHLISFSEQYTEMRNELSGVEKKLSAMQRLCRTLNAERNQYISQLKDHNIEPLTPPVIENPELEQPQEGKSSSTQLKETVKLRRELNKMKEELREMGRADTLGKEKLSQKEETLLGLREDLAKLKISQQLTDRCEEGECTHSSSQPSSSTGGKIKRPRKAKGKGKVEASLPVASASSGSLGNGVSTATTTMQSGDDSAAALSSANSTTGEQMSLDGIALDRLSSIDGLDNDVMVEDLVQDVLSIDSFDTDTIPVQNGNTDVTENGNSNVHVTENGYSNVDVTDSSSSAADLYHDQASLTSDVSTVPANVGDPRGSD